MGPCFMRTTLPKFPNFPKFPNKKTTNDFPLVVLTNAPQMLPYKKKLLLAEVDLNRHSREVPLLTELILQESTI